MRKPIPKAKVPESTVYRTEVKTSSRVTKEEREAKKQLKEKLSKPTYPFKLKISFRKHADCERFAKLIHCDIKASDKEIKFKAPPEDSTVVGKFVGEPKKKTSTRGLSEFHASHWKGMPEFEQEVSVWIYHSLSLIFDDANAYAAFARLVRQHLSTSTKSIYYPKWTPEKARNKKWVSSLPAGKLIPRYPIYIVSFGRAHSRLTSKSLEAMNVPYFIVVEPQQYDTYASVIDPKKILTLPYTTDPKNPTGPGRARNWCRDHSISMGFDRHWVMDDNIHGFYRLHQNHRYKVADGAIFKAAEDFVDRYENIWIAGFQYRFFCAQKSKYPPFVANTRIYSCLLIDNTMILHFDEYEFLWRERYNEDTILSLDVLENGYCTVQFNSFLQGKVGTQTLKGGNSEIFYEPEGSAELKDLKVKNYNPGGTIQKTLNLKLIYPKVAKSVFKFNRWHHEVNYSKYKDNALIPKKRQKISEESNNYGMRLVDMSLEDERTEEAFEKEQKTVKTTWK
jgi:hypothetical protein